MRGLSENQTVTNLTELWWSEDKQWVLEENGFTRDGSDYEIFRDFCECIRRMPNSPEAWRSRQQLKALFGLDPESARWHPPLIWRETAEQLLAHPTTRAQAQRILTRIEKTTVPPPREHDPQRGIKGFPVPLSDRTIHADHWEAWEAQALEFCDCVYEKGKHVMLSLPRSFHVEKPDLYHVNRHLSRVDRNDNLWKNQMAIFLLRFCSQRGIPAVLDCGCRWGEVESLLRMAVKFTPLPNLIWAPRRTLSRVGFQAVVRAVLQGRGGDVEGIPPVHVYLERENYPTYLPGHLCIKFF